jgi:hypothetical protein
LLLADTEGGKHTKEEIEMKKLGSMMVLVMLVALAQSGCMFLGGAALGAAGTGAAYEINAHQQLERLEADYKAERISRAEYESRKKQIESGSLVY